MRPSETPLCSEGQRAVEWAHGWLTVEEAAGLEEHLAQCQACSDLVAECRVHQSAAKGFPDEEPSSELLARIVAAARPELRKLRRRSTRRRWLTLPLSAAALLLAGLALFAWLQGDDLGGDLGPNPEQLQHYAWLTEAMDAQGDWLGSEDSLVRADAVGLHALALLALSSVSVPATAERQEHLLRSARWLIQQQRVDGSLGRPPWSQSFDHPVATLALLTSWQVSGDAEVHQAADRALTCLVDNLSEPSGPQRNAGLWAWKLQTLLVARDLGWSGLSAPISLAQAALGRDLETPEARPFDRPELRALALGRPTSPGAPTLGPVHAASLAILDG